MLAKARARLPGIKFEKADTAHWRDAAPFDWIFANAVLQWIPRHISLMASLIARLAAGGSLAIQMPDNLNEPSQALMREVAGRAPFRDKLGGASAARETIGDFADYYAALAPHCAATDVWRTTYVHALPGPDAIVEWVKGTGLRPYLACLAQDEREAVPRPISRGDRRRLSAASRWRALLSFSASFPRGGAGRGDDAWLTIR
jgi:trans-aconitate 2-methyltransferase